MIKVAITTTSFAEYDAAPLSALKEKGFEVILNPYGRKINKKEILELCSEATGIIAGTESYDIEVLELFARHAAVQISDYVPYGSLKVISRCGTGIDNVDLKAAELLGIKVFNTPDAPTLAVAELSIGLIFDMLRKISFVDRSIRGGVWKKQMGNLLCGKNVGIIGFGKIGRKVAELLVPFGCTIRYYDIGYGFGKISDHRGSIVERVELLDLLNTSDIISIHVSCKDNILGSDELVQIKKGAWLVNVSRGGVIDEQALYQALQSGHLAGAALDVFTEEPYCGPLTELDNVILTAHIGSYATESRIEMERQAVTNLLIGLQCFP